MSMTDAFFPDDDPPISGCQFIAAEKPHYTDVDKCGLPPLPGSPYCPAHHAVAFMVGAGDGPAVVR